MKIKQIISNVATILGYTEVVNLINSNAAEEELVKNTNYSILMRCANLVASNVAGNYIDCTERQSFNTADGKINYSDFNKTFLKVISVTSNGQSAPFELYTYYISVPAGQVEIVYSAIPEFKSGNDDANFLGAHSQGVLTYGILTEYAFISGMFNEGKIWNERFEQLLFTATSKEKTKIMPQWRI